jgi:acrylyl-CoA reductase (NADPH)
LLAQLGFDGHRLHRPPEEAEHLKALGATDIIDRATLNGARQAAAARNAGPARWTAWAATPWPTSARDRYGGVVAACGLAQGMDFPSTVAPFILRGVTLPAWTA